MTVLCGDSRSGPHPSKRSWRGSARSSTTWWRCPGALAPGQLDILGFGRSEAVLRDRMDCRNRRLSGNASRKRAALGSRRWKALWIDDARRLW